MEKGLLCIQFIRGVSRQVWIVLGFFSIIFFSFLEPDLSNFTVIPVDRPDFMFESVTFSYIHDGDLTWSFMAASASIDKVEQMTVLSSIEGDFYQDGLVVLQVSSPRGLLNMETSQLFLEKAEVLYVIRDQSVTLNASELTWDPEVLLFEGRGAVTVLSDSVALSGEYFSIDVVNQQLEMSENSRASIREIP